jgi:acyl carrier protein
MSAYQAALAVSPVAAPGHLSGGDDVMQTVMSVLRGIRPLQSNGLPYDETSGLSDAGFTSVEMVKVMLGVEAAFDLMIPQDMITPENFLDANAITAMISRLLRMA